MSYDGRITLTLAAAIVAAVAVVATGGWKAQAQTPARVQTAPGMAPVNDLPNPYQTVESYFKLPPDRKFGATSAIEIDKDGKTIWVAERCGGNSGCLANPLVDPILHFDENGNFMRSFGAGLFSSPHGIFVDKDGNIWVTDYADNSAPARGGGAGAAAPGAAAGAGAGRGAGRGAAAAPAPPAAAGAPPDAAAGAGRGRGGRGAGAAAGAGAPGAGAAGAAAGGQAAGRGAPVIPNPNATMGHQVIKFDTTGKELMRIGKKGGAKPPECCYQPNDVLVAPNGDIFVTQGHGTAGVNYLFKFDKTGTLLKAFGKDGDGPGEFNQPHSLAMDSKGRLFVADRANNRIQIFDQNFKFLAVWYQFSRPSGIFIDKKDNLYSADSESGGINLAHGAWKRGMRIGSAKDGTVRALIPDPSGEGVTFAMKDGRPTLTRADGTNWTGGTLAAEGVAADAKGNIFGAEVGPQKVQRYVLKRK